MHYFCILTITYRVIDKSITLVIDKDESGATVVWEDLSNAHDMTELIHKLPVFHVEIIEAPRLKDYQQ